MSQSKRLTDTEITQIYSRHVRTIYRVCYAFMKNPSDTEDAVQETFYRLITKGPVLESEEHEKAWLIRTASNICRNNLRSWWRKRENIDDYYNLSDKGEIRTDDIFRAVMSLPDKYKTPVYLYYYEGYNSREIAGILKKTHSTIRNHLHEARRILRERLGEEFDEE